MIDKAFPTPLIALDLGAAAVYFYGLNYRMAIYWVSAAVLTACVTYK
jgi:energy-converting hydrogenase Eha subunit A